MLDRIEFNSGANVVRRCVVSVSKLCCGCLLLTIFMFLYNGLYLFCDEIKSDVSEGENQSDIVYEILESLSNHYNNINIGAVEVNPAYQLAFVSDDNIFGSAKDRKKDIYYLHKTGLSGKVQFSDHSLSFNHKAEIFDYNRFKELDHVNQSLAAGLVLNFSNGFKVRLRDQFKANRIPARIQRRFGDDSVDLGITLEDFGLEREKGPNVFVPRRDITTNIATLDVDFPDFITDVDFSFHYKNNDISYQRDENGNAESNIDTMDFEVDYAISPEINVSGMFGYNIQRYDSSNNNDNIKKKFALNLNWLPVARKIFFLNANYDIVTYGSRSEWQDFEGWKLALGYRYVINSRSIISFTSERSIQEQRRMDNNANFFTAAGLNYSIKMFERFNASLDLSYTNLKFFEKNEGAERIEKVDSFKIRMGLVYDYPKWWFAGFNYTYDRRDSNLSGGDLTHNVLMFNVGINF